jgi:hypothetical protein
MAAALCDFFPCLVVRKRNPFGADGEARGDLEQRVEYKGFGLADALLHGENAHEMRTNTEMIALRLDVRVHHLEVEELSALWSSSDPHVLVIQQATKECELFRTRQGSDLYKVCKLPAERLDPLL